MRKIIVALAAAAALVAGAAAPVAAAPEGSSAAASRYGAGSFSVGNAQLLSSGCFYHPYIVNLTALGGYYWDADIRITAPNGALADMNYMTGTGSGSTSFSEEMLLCSSLDQPGTYTITGTITVYDYYYDFVSENPLTPATFQVLPYVPPAPPVADVTGSATRTPGKNIARIALRTDSTPAGYAQGAKAVFRVVVDGRARTYSLGAGKVKVVNKRFRPRSGTHRVKVAVNGRRSLSFRVKTG